MDRTAHIPADAQVQVLGLIAEMRASCAKPSRVSAISDQMEVLVRSYMVPSSPDPVPGVRLTKMEGRIVARLQAAAGNVVTRDQFMDAMYFDQHSEPSPKIIDVLVCRLRKKLAPKGLAIEADWGRGYRIKETA